MTEGNNGRDLKEDTSAKHDNKDERKHRTEWDIALENKNRKELKRLLHIALLKEYEELLGYFFESLKDFPKFDDFVHKKFETERFDESTYHLPLTTAAITGNDKLIDILLDNNVHICKQSNDNRGDTVLHSLARLVPTDETEKEKIFSVLVRLAKEYEKKRVGSPWLLTNNEGMTVLNVATIVGAVDIVQYIIEEQNKSCIPNVECKNYFEYHDFSLIDNVANKDRCTETNDATSHCSPCSTYCCQTWRSCIKGYSYSVFEMLFTHDINTETVVSLLKIKTVEEVLKAKWNNCKLYVIIWAILHFAIMCVLTRYAVVHSDVVVVGVQRDEEFAYKIFTTIVGFIYCMVATLAILNKLMRPKVQQHLLHNIAFVILLCVFGVCSLLNFVHVSATRVLLVIIVITGWFFMTFFLMPFKYFSFFNEMLKRVFLDIFVPYTILLTLNLVSFTAAMYVLLNTKDNTYRFVDVLFTMFKLMLGLSEVEEIEAANFTVLAYCIYIAFVILTFLFLMNALIAAMGATFEYYNTDAKYRQLSLEKLSVMLFLDDTIFLFSKTLLNKEPRKMKFFRCANNKISGTSIGNTNSPGSRIKCCYACFKTSELAQEGQVNEGIYTLKIPLYENPEAVKKLPESKTQMKVPKATPLLTCQKFFLTDKFGRLLASVNLKSFEDAISLKNYSPEHVFDIETNSQNRIKLESGESILFALQKTDQDISSIKTEELEVKYHNEEKGEQFNVADPETKNIPAGSMKDTKKEEERNSEESTTQAEVENLNENSKHFERNVADHGTENHIPNRNMDDPEKQERLNTVEGMKQPEEEDNNENIKIRETDNTDDHITNENEENREKQKVLNSDKGIEQPESEKCKDSSKHFETNAAEYATKNHVEIEKENIVQMQRPATDLMLDDVSCADVPPKVKSPDEIGVDYENDIRLPVNIKQQDTKKEEKHPKRQRRKDENYILVKKHKSTTYDHGFLCKHYGITFTSPLSPAERARLPACLKEN